MIDQKQSINHSDTEHLPKGEQRGYPDSSNESLKLKQKQRNRVQHAQANYAMQLKSPRF